MASYRRSLVLGACLLCAPLVALGCDFAALADIGETLLDPDAALLDSPGRRLVEGTYSSLVVDGSRESGGNVVALRWDTPEQRVAIVPYPEGEPCEIKPAVDFERVSSRVDVALEGLLAVQQTEDESGRGKIVFVGFDCEERLPSLPDALLPSVLYPSDEPRGMLTITGSGELLLIDAVNVSVEKLASDVVTAQVKSGLIFTLEGGEFVVRDERFEELARGGRGVTDFVTTGGDVITAAFVDADGLSIFDLDSGIEPVASDACAPESLGSDVVAFYAPCAERRMNLLLAGARVGQEGKVQLLGPRNVIRLAETLTSWGGGDSTPTELTFVTAEDEGARLGALRHAAIPADAEFIPRASESGLAAEATLEFTAPVIEEEVFLSGGELYLEWDGEAGTLVALARDDDRQVVGVETLAVRVAQLPGSTPFSSRGVLAHYEDGLGDLVRLRELSSDVGGVATEVLARGVPIQTHQVDPETGDVAFVANVDSRGRGDLVLMAGDGEPRVVVEGGVLPDKERFLEQPRGIIYLGWSDEPYVANLHAWLRDSELDLLIHEDVSEYRSLPWPSPGVLYAVPEGDDAGLWFSKAR
jgi:hypothetical protein